MNFDPTLTLGNVLTVLSFIGVGVIGFRNQANKSAKAHNELVTDVRVLEGCHRETNRRLEGIENRLLGIESR